MNSSSIKIALLISLITSWEIAYSETTKTTELSPKKPQIIDRIVAVVYGKPVLASQIEGKITPQGVYIEISDYPADERADTMTRGLNDAVNFILVERKIEELGIKVTNEQLEQQIQRILADNNKTMEQLEEYFRSQGKTMAQYKADLEKQMKIAQFRGRVLRPLIQNMDKSKERRSPETLEVETRLIFIKANESMGKSLAESKKNMIFEAYDKINQGMDFVEAEKIYSELGSGKPNSFKIAELLPAVKEAILKVPTSDLKQITKPFLAGEGWHIFHITKRSYAAKESEASETSYIDQQRLIDQQMRIWLENERKKINIELIPI